LDPLASANVFSGQGEPEMMLFMIDLSSGVHRFFAKLETIATNIVSVFKAIGEHFGP